MKSLIALFAAVGPMVAAVPAIQTNIVQGPLDPHAVTTQCNLQYTVQPDDFCSSATLGKKFGNFTYTQLYKWNPSIGRTCALAAYSTICVGSSDYTFVPPIQPPGGTLVPDSDLPVPIIGCAPSNCTRWGYSSPGMLTSQLLKAANVTLDTFKGWNPCTFSKDGNPENGLWGEYWYCVGV